MPMWCNGSHEGLKIPWTVMSVPVRVRPSVQWEGDREFHFLSNLYIGGFKYLTLLQVTLST